MRILLKHVLTTRTLLKPPFYIQLSIKMYILTSFMCNDVRFLFAFINVKCFRQQTKNIYHALEMILPFFVAYTQSHF